MRLTGSQIAAAISLVGLTRESLCKEAAIAKNTLIKILNNDAAAYRENTINKIRDILEMRGVEFLPGEGVRKKDRMTETHEGDDANQHLLDDVYNTLKDTGGEVLISHVDETKAIESVSKEFLDNHLKRLAKAGIKERMLVRMGDTNLITDYEAYRAIPDKYYVSTAMFIYGDKLGLASWLGAKRAVIVHDALFAESARRLFNFVWDHAEVLGDASIKKKDQQ